MIHVVQLGARMRYAVPRILENNGSLAHLHTDIAGDRGWPKLLRALPRGLRPAPLRRLLGRRIEGIPANRVSAHGWLGMKIAWRERHARTPEALARAHIRSGHELCRLALRGGFGNATVAGAIGTSSEPLLAAAKQSGLRTFKEQIIAPPSVERRILDEERRRFPDWESQGELSSWYDLFENVARREWGLADMIVCGSEFVRTGVAEAGGPHERCVVVPYGIDLPAPPPRAPDAHDGRPLRVLTVGSLTLRKGAPYVLAAARELAGRAEFRWAGGNHLSPRGEAEMRSAVTLLGHVPRDEILALYAWADVFLLPSLCEGSATVCYEALVCGVPVVTTPNSGAVVRDGIDGFVVPVRDIAALVDRLRILDRDRARLCAMSENARVRATEFTLDRYGERLVAALRPLLDVRSREPVGAS